MNPLIKLRKELKPILDIRKAMGHRMKYDDGSGEWFKGDRDESFREGCTICENIIIDLANKYKKERQRGA